MNQPLPSKPPLTLRAWTACSEALPLVPGLYLGVLKTKGGGTLVDTVFFDEDGWAWEVACTAVVGVEKWTHLPDADA